MMRPDIIMELRQDATGLSLRAAAEIDRLRTEIARLRMTMGPVPNNDPLVKWEQR